MTQQWNTGQTAASIALSGGNLTATATQTSTLLSAFALESAAASSLLYWELVITFATASDNGAGIGITTSADTTWIGQDTTTIGWYGTGSVFNAGSMVATWATYTSGARLGFAMDLTHNKLWGRVGAGNWNNDILANQNPATNTGGFAIPSGVTAGSIVPGLTVFDATTPDKVIGAFASGSWVGAAPSGFSAFDPTAGAATKDNMMLLGAGLVGLSALRRDFRPIRRLLGCG